MGAKNSHTFKSLSSKKEKEFPFFPKKKVNLFQGKTSLIFVTAELKITWMSYHTMLWILFILLLITYSVIKKKVNKNVSKSLFALMIFIFLGQMLLPRQLFLKWNAISKLNDKRVIKIVLQPSEPNWKVNLVDKNFIVFDRNQIDTLTSLLKKAEVYFPSHSTRIWETKMILITTNDKDTFEIKVSQTDNNGAVINTTTNEWRKDEIGKYLERNTKYHEASYSDTATLKL